MREKVMKGLECCKQSTADDPFQMCGECPYNEISIAVQDCRAVLNEDAFELLKKQQEMIQQRDQIIKDQQQYIIKLGGGTQYD